MTASRSAARDALRQAWAIDARWLLPLLVLFALKGALIAALFAPFTGHDEVDHFFYIERLADREGLGEFGRALLPPAAEPFKAFVADFPYNAEVIQPPLYHLLLAPLYAVLPGGLFAKLLALRLVSVAIGTLTVVVAYAIAVELFPGEVGVRAGTAVFVALQPQFAFEAAIVNHDIFVIFLATLLVWLALVWGRSGFTRRRLVWLGVVVGAGILTKVSFGLMLPVVALAVALYGWHGKRTRWSVVGEIATVAGVGLAIASPWFVRSLRLYGDPTGAQQLRSIPGYGEQAQSVRAMVGSVVFWRGRLEDFWGNFGWRLVPLDPNVYHAIYLVWFAAAAGLTVSLAYQIGAKVTGWPQLLDERQLVGLAVIGAWIVAMVVGVVYVGTIQFTQSRFAFPGMAAFGIATAAGFALPLPARWRWVVGPVLFAAMLALNIATTVRFVGPFYAGEGGRAGILP